MREKQFLMSKTKQSLKLFPQAPDKAQTFGQGTLAEGKGSVPWTSSLRLLFCTKKNIFNLKRS
jgi:hypothetical protein